MSHPTGGFLAVTPRPYDAWRLEQGFVGRERDRVQVVGKKSVAEMQRRIKRLEVDMRRMQCVVHGAGAAMLTVHRDEEASAER